LARYFEFFNKKISDFKFSITGINGQWG